MMFALVAVLLGAAAPQDSEPRVLLRLEDEWALALIHRDGAVFRRLLADGFIYSEDDRTMSRDDVLHEVVAGTDTVKAAHNAINRAAAVEWAEDGIGSTPSRRSP